MSRKQYTSDHTCPGNASLANVTQTLKMCIIMYYYYNMQLLYIQGDVCYNSL